MSMGIGGTSSYVSPLYQVQGAQASQVSSGSDSDGDSDGSGSRVHRGHGGGQMQQALLQALQSLGLSVPAQTSGTSAITQQASTGTDSDGDSDGSTSASSGIKRRHAEVHAGAVSSHQERFALGSRRSGCNWLNDQPAVQFRQRPECLNFPGRQRKRTNRFAECLYAIEF